MVARSPVTRPRSPLDDQPGTSSRPNRRRSRADRRQTTIERRQPSDDIPEVLARRVIVERVQPSIDNGRWPIKRTVGEPVRVVADIFADGHDVVVAVLRDRDGRSAQEETAGEWRETPMTL